MGSFPTILENDSSNHQSLGAFSSCWYLLALLVSMLLYKKKTHHHRQPQFVQNNLWSIRNLSGPPAIITTPPETTAVLVDRIFWDLWRFFPIFLGIRGRPLTPFLDSKFFENKFHHNRRIFWIFKFLLITWFMGCVNTYSDSGWDLIEDWNTYGAPHATPDLLSGSSGPVCWSVIFGRFYCSILLLYWNSSQRLLICYLFFSLFFVE